MKKLLLILAFFVVAGSLHAQMDDFGGWTNAPGPAEPNTQSATCSQSGTTITCTVTNGSVYRSTNGGQRIRLSDCGNSALNFVFASDTNNGAPHITGIASNTVTMTTDGSSGTVASTACTFAPAQFNVATLSGPGGCNGPRLVTPEGNCYEAEMMTYPGCAQNFGNCSAAKYGATNTNCVGAADQFAQWQTWGFNGVMQPQTNLFVPASSGACSSLGFPFGGEQFVSQYASVNLNGLAANPVVNVSMATGPHWASDCTTYRPMIDYYSPQFQPFAQAWITSSQVAPWFNYPGMFIFQFDDIGSNDLPTAGPDFPTIFGGPHDCDPAMMVAISSPIVTGSWNTFYGGGLSACDAGATCVLYTDPENYSKIALMNALTTEYSTVGALNTAYGTSYTTLGSSGACIGYTYSWCASTAAAESFGTGDGTTLTFSHTLASHSSVSPSSVAIFVSGTEVAFDCTGFWVSGCSPSAGTGVLTGPTLSTGSINYSTGVASVTFASGHAPASSAAITVKYTQNGWTLGTGLLDEAGATTALGTEGHFILARAQWATGTYTGGDLLYDPTSNSWQVDATAGTKSTGASKPTFSATAGVNTTDNQVTWQSEGAPIFTANMNQTMAADLENGFLRSLADTFYTATCGTLHTQYPGAMCGGTDTSGTWFTPPRKQILQSLAAHADLITYIQGDPSFDTTAQGKYMFVTRWAGASMPIVNSQQFYTSSQNQGTVDTNPSFSTILLMGAAWDTLQTWMSTAVGANGTVQWAGIGWGGSHNIGGCTACGLKDNLDNAYDGHENVTGAVSCSAPNTTLPCGNETTGAWIGQNAIGTTTNGLILNGNCLWFGCGASINPVAPAPQGFAVNISDWLESPFRLSTNDVLNLFPGESSIPEVGDQR